MKISIFLIFVSLLISGYQAEVEHFWPLDFWEIFPFVSNEALWKLCDALNNLTDKTSGSGAVLDKWFEKNWVNPDSIDLPKPRSEYGKLAHRHLVPEIAHSYLEYRNQVRNYQQFLYYAVQDLEFFDNREADKMSSIFWSYATSEYHDYDEFFVEASIKFRKTHVFTRSSLKLLTGTYLKMNNISPFRGLKWVLDTSF